MGGLGRAWPRPRPRLLDKLEARARSRNVKTVRLETNRHLHEGINLYRSAGYEEVDPFNDESYAHHWFEKRLGDPPGGRVRRS